MKALSFSLIIGLMIVGAAGLQAANTYVAACAQRVESAMQDTLTRLAAERARLNAAQSRREALREWINGFRR